MHNSVDQDKDSSELLEDNEAYLQELPPEFTLIGAMGTKPCSIDKALCRPNAKAWQEALEYEITQLEKLWTWEIFNCPKNEPVIPCTEVLKEKCEPTSEMEKYQVHIVTGRHRKIKGINYCETFSTAIKMPSVCVVLANTAEQDWEIHQTGMKSAYLCTLLKEQIFMKPLCGVLKPRQEGKVCWLVKGLYHLKQAGRGWY